VTPIASAWFALLLAGAPGAAGQEAPPPALDPRVKAALERFDRGEKEAALRELETLRRAAGQDGVVMFSVAHELERREEYAAAEPFARRAFELLPAFGPTHVVLGVSLIFSDRVEEAERVFRAAAARFAGTQDEPDLVFNLGMACALQNKRIEASEWFAKAIAFQPGNALFRFSAAENDRNLKRLDLAEEGFRRAMRGPGGHPDAGWKLAVTLAAQGRAEEAEPLFRSALASGPAPSRLGASFEYAVFLFERGRAAESAPLLEAVVKARPEDRVAWHYLARTLRALGRREAAAAALERYQALQARADRSDTEYLLELIRGRLRGGGPRAEEKKSPERR